MKRQILLICCLFFSVSAFAKTTWIDVRSEAEYQEDHIEGDMWVPHKQIVEEVELLLPNKSQEIRLYCKSGIRSGIAMQSLQEAGYMNVLNVGGIDNAKRIRAIKAKKTTE